MKRLAVFISCVSSLTCFSQWSTTDAPANGYRYDDVFFLNETLGWAVSGSGDIFKTTNGLNWQSVEQTEKYNRCIEFASEVAGFCGTLDSSFYKTTDGGETWTDIAGTINPHPPGICGLSIPEPNVIYGCGVYFSPAYIIKSTDQGNTWTTIDLSAYADGLVDIHFIDANRGFVSGRANPVTDGGIILYTGDGGVTWTVKHKTLNPQDYTWKMQTPDGVNYFASIQGGPPYENTRIIKSSDAGQTWTTKIIADEYNYSQMIGFIDSDHGWTGGGAGPLHLETVDGGETWSGNYPGISSSNRFFKINDNLAYLSGGRIYRYQVDSIVSIPEMEDYRPVHQLTASPNPASDIIKISLKLNTNTFCDLGLYDASGKLVKQLIHERLSPSEKEILVPVGDLLPQTLFVSMQTHEGVMSVKVVKE